MVGRAGVRVTIRATARLPTVLCRTVKWCAGSCAVRLAVLSSTDFSGSNLGITAHLGGGEKFDALDHLRPWQWCSFPIRAARQEDAHSWLPDRATPSAIGLLALPVRPIESSDLFTGAAELVTMHEQPVGGHATHTTESGWSGAMSSAPFACEAQLLSAPENCSQARSRAQNGSI